MVPRCNSFKAQGTTTFNQAIKLEMSIAFNTRVWRGASNMGCHVRIHHVLVELLRKVKDQMINP